MELLGERDGYRSQVIFEPKGVVTQRDFHHSIVFSERCMQGDCKSNSELRNVILKQMKFLLA